LQNSPQIPHPVTQQKERQVSLNYMRVFESKMKHQDAAAPT